MDKEIPEEKSDKISNKGKLLIISALFIVGVGTFFSVAWVISEIELQHMEKILGYNADGYFCRGIDGETYFPLEECQDTIDKVGTSVKELKDENAIIKSDV